MADTRSGVQTRHFLTTAALAGAVLVFDVSLPLGVAGGVPYVVLVLVGLWLPGRKTVLWLAALGSVLTITGYFLSEPAGTPWMVLTNRALALFAIWATAVLAYQRLAAEERGRQHQRDTLLANQANLVKSRFLAAASHDLRQPLQSVGLYLSVLLRRFDDPGVHEVGGKMRQSLDTMTELLETLLDLSALDSGAITPEVESFAVQGCLDRVALALSAHAEEKGLALRIEPCSVFVRSDPVLLQRIVENFVNNAVRYTDAGEVRVACHVDGDEVRIDTVDNGIGIPEAELKSVFDEYFQLESPMRDQRNGVGLGLSIVKHIAQLLGHQIGVTSVVGEGSTFSVHVPRAGPPADDAGTRG